MVMNSIKFVKEDQNNWRRFLHTTSGMRGLLRLQEFKPVSTLNDQAHNVILEAGIVRGYDKLLADLRELGNVEENTPEIRDEPESLEDTRTY